MSNTGRLATLVLPNCKLIDVGPERPFDESLIDTDGSWLLYPGSNPAPRGRMPKCLVVLDASFRRAKRMYRRIEVLRQLPELALPPPIVVPDRLRQPPRSDGMSTIEAIAAGLGLIENPKHAEVLLRTFSDFVRRADAAHGRVRPSRAAPPPPDSG